MKRPLVTALMMLVLLFAAVVPAAHAILQQVGPNNSAPPVGGYPAWYQDTTGLALEFCDPKNQAEVDGGWCLLLPGDPPAVPEVFPTQFFDEHFWFAADAGITTANGGRALLVLAVEAAFAAAVEPGGQITFSRIRVKLTNVPVAGTYRFIHPYGQDFVTCPDDCRGAAGDLIFVTDDVGIERPFDGALQSRLGPFLLPSNSPGGVELAAVPGPAPGKLYIADPARSGPVTGSVARDNPADLPGTFREGGTGTMRSRNIFRIEGPPGSNLGGPGVDFVETTNFTLMGRVFQGPIAGRVTVDRASYEQPTAGPNKITVFATAFPATQGRLPAGNPPAVVTPQLVYFDGPCFDPITGDSALTGLTNHQMFRAGSTYWGQSAPAAIPASPAEVCVVQTNALAANNQFTSAFFPARLGDQILITEALYNPGPQSLSVKASSKDAVGAPTLNVAGFGDIGPTGQLLVSPLTAPPATVSVHSSKGGFNELQVSTGAGTTGDAGINVPIALNDGPVVIQQGAAATPISVLANDSMGGSPIPAGAIVTRVAAPQLGSAVVNANGTISYTPNPTATGTDIFTYTVTVNGIVSNEASVTITIGNVNDPPTATNDSVAAIANLLTPINVLANDTDPDGQADIVAVANLTQPTPAGASVALQPDNRTVNFTATTFGTYSFTYQARDAGGLLSNVATVTVTVAGGETLTITRAELRANGGRLRVEGTIAPAAGQTLTIQFAANNQVIAGSQVFTAVADAVGLWAVDARNVTAPGSATQVKVTSSNGTVQFAPLLRR